MSRYIDREDLLNNLKQFAPELLKPLIVSLIEKQPTADVAEVRHGKWNKNGKRIFEGDIVWLKNDEEPYQVAFDECCFQVYSHGVCYVMDNFYDHDIEVIGNIFDNPEMLR